MKTRISVQERLKDLRVEQGLNLEELAQKTGISKSALGSYENDNDERSLLKKLFKKSPLIKQSGMNFRRRPWK